MTGRRHDAPQLVLDLHMPPRFGREDFLPAPCNARASAFLDSWPDWSDPIALLLGGAGVGKSHLAAIWAERAGAAVRTAATLDDRELQALEGAAALVVEDADRAPRDERALFHLVDRARLVGTAVLFTARLPPDAWGVRVPDLLSRLRLAPATSIADPDDALVRAVLVKLLADRQVAVDAGLVDYAARHLGRSLAAARLFVELADRRALAAGRRITRAIAADVLREIFADEDDDD